MTTSSCHTIDELVRIHKRLLVNEDLMISSVAATDSDFEAAQQVMSFERGQGLVFIPGLRVKQETANPMDLK